MLQTLPEEHSSQPLAEVLSSLAPLAVTLSGSCTERPAAEDVIVKSGAGHSDLTGKWRTDRWPFPKAFPGWGEGLA